ncbi:MAG: STAS domain-containing protein [Bacteroidota bacterium]
MNGELDASSALQLDDAIQEAVNLNHKLLLFDCEQLHYISSPGIGVFTSRIEDYEQKKIFLVLHGMNEKVFNVFKILGLDKILPIVNGKEEAKKMLDGALNKD